MSQRKSSYTLIEQQRDLEDFYRQAGQGDWICFDTEFVGEKRYQTLLCLIQASTEEGNYLIDPFKVKDLSPFLDLLTNPAIIKVTHAGDNDYRLLHSLYGLVPKHTFDTQLAAGFVGYRYPISLSKLVEAELGRQMKKGYAVTDWEERPFTQKQLEYALEDVLLLPGLWRSLERKLRDVGRYEWLREESSQMENEAYFKRDPHHEALNSNLIRGLKSREQIFLIRLLEWRRNVAEEKDYSKEMVLPSKLISQIVRTVRAGADALLDNRRIPDHVVKRYGKLFEKMYQQPATDEEKALLKRLPTEGDEDDRDDMLLELLYLLMKVRSTEENVAHQLVMPRNAIKRMKNDPEVREQILGSGWRRELLGEEFVSWLEHYDKLDVHIEGGRIEVKIAE